MFIICYVLIFFKMQIQMFKKTGDNFIKFSSLKNDVCEQESNILMNEALRKYKFEIKNNKCYFEKVEILGSHIQYNFINNFNIYILQKLSR